MYEHADEYSLNQTISNTQYFCPSTYNAINGYIHSFNLTFIHSYIPQAIWH